MNIPYYWIGLIFFGIIFLIVGISLNRKSVLFLGKPEMTEARVTKIYKTHRHGIGNYHSRLHSMYIIYAEYIVDGELISGKHFEPLRHSFIKFHEGDIIKIKINRKKPKLFCLETVNIYKEFITSIKIIVFSAILVAVASFLLFNCM